MSAIAVITRKNAVHAALSLIVTLVSLAGLYLMLYAPFVAGVQIVLYAGGIMVLFLFVIMLVNLDQNIREIQFNKQWMVGADRSVIARRIAAVRDSNGTRDLSNHTERCAARRTKHAADRARAVRPVHVSVRDCVTVAAGGHRRRGGHGEEEDLRSSG